MIRGIFYQKLRIGEFIQFIDLFLAAVKGGNPLTLGIQIQYLALEAQWKELQQLFKLALGSELTIIIEALDERRDRAISGLRLHFESLTYHMDPVRKAAAQKLLKVIDKYGKGIARKNYLEESSILKGILKDWENSADLTQALTLLNVVEWKEELKTANDEFDVVYLERAGEEADIPEASATELREPAMDAYRTLLKHMEAHMTLAEDKTPYKKLAGKLNKVVEKFNQLVIDRQGGESNEEEETAESSGTVNI